MPIIHLQDLGKISYAKAWAYQKQLFAELLDRKKRRRNGELNEHTHPKHYFLLCEHPHVYTLGRNGSESNLLMSAEKLAENGIDYFKINRGGDITYHGPGQIVGYPILDLEDFFTDIGRYMRSLEEVIIGVLAKYGIAGDRLKGATGVWLEPSNPFRARKICAMGIHASRWITMHGFALNVNTDLSLFENIIPCGITDKAVTSMKKELGDSQDFAEVKKNIILAFGDIFEAEFTTASNPFSVGHKVGTS